MQEKIKKFLRKEAKLAFKGLSYWDRKKYGNYKALYADMKDAWNKGNTIEIPSDWEEKMRDRRVESGLDVKGEEDYPIPTGIAQVHLKNVENFVKESKGKCG